MCQGGSVISNAWLHVAFLTQGALLSPFIVHKG